jgi:hypothetical protein
MSLNYSHMDKSATSPISKSYDVPPFEEAFEVDSLKQFYQRQDSFSQTSSPHKEPEMNEEYISGEVTSEHLLASPLGRYIKRVGDDPSMANPVLDIELESGMPNTYSTMNSSEQDQSFLKIQNRFGSENGQFMRNFDRPTYMDMGDNGKMNGSSNPLGVQRAISLPSNNSIMMNNTQPLFQDKGNLEELIKNKKVFNIQRNQKSPQILKGQSNKTTNPINFSLNGHSSNNLNFESMNGFNMNNQPNLMMNYNNPIDKSNNYNSIMNYLKVMKDRTRSDEIMPEINFMQKKEF